LDLAPSVQLCQSSGAAGFNSWPHDTHPRCIDDAEDAAGAQLDDKKGRPVILVGTPRGAWRAENFHQAVDYIGDHGGAKYSPDDIREMEICKGAFEKAAKFIDTRIRQVKKNPSRIG